MMTAGELKKILHYDAETGLFSWRVRRRGTSKNKIAGTNCASEHVRIVIDGRSYKAHRLAWLYVYGAWPSDQIDHADCDRSNNKISNLRLATSQGNGANRGLNKNNSSGAKGVHWHRRAGKWNARIMVSGVTIHLGLFSELSDAKEAYRLEAEKHFGEFARAA